MRASAAFVVLLPLVVLVTLFVLIGTRGAGGAQDGMWWDEQVASFVRHRISTTYVDEVDKERAERAFYKAMDAYVHELDEYCDFIPPEEHRKYLEDTAGEYAGLGVKIVPADEGLLIVGIFPDGPADQAGLEVDDKIVAADGTSLEGMELGQIEKAGLLKGEPGSTVKVTIIPGPLPAEGEAPKPRRDVPVVRAKVRPPSVFTRRVGAEDRYGVIRLSEFTDATEEDFNDTLDRMLAAGVKGLVLDLRRNPGGTLPTAVAVVDRFVEKGTIVRMEGRTKGATRNYTAKVENTIPDTMPLVVLVDGTSASASEVVAGALQDHRRAILVGERTYGKFLVQQVVEIQEHEVALKLTTSRYYLPSGRSYQRPRKNGNGTLLDPRGRQEAPRGGGLLPDIVVPMTKEQHIQLEKQFENQDGVIWREKPQFPEAPLDWIDPHLERAVQILEGQVVLRKIRGTR